MTQIPSTQLIEVLKMFSGEYTEDLYWQVDKDDPNILNFYVECSDLFYYATADFELITSEKLGLLYEAKKDLDALNLSNLHKPFGLLFAARARGMRPLSGYYKYLHPDVQPLFDACGPKRTVRVVETNPIPIVQTDAEEVE